MKFRYADILGHGDIYFITKLICNYASLIIELALDFDGVYYSK